MRTISLVLSALALIAVAACAPGGAPEVSRRSEEAPPGAAPGTCWGKYVSPAVIETVTEQVVARPAKLNEDGSVLRPAVYKTETVQRIVRERVETWFERPCDEVLTEEFVASLQRALAVRNLYHGPVTGRMDSRTEAAVRRYQKPLGLDTGILTLETARKLGLVAIALKKG
ncbi:MAG: peptidoglycan-binding protein [Pseudodonghicola sp.]|uniref:peptidoglycan-binding domain-containing protein n=1 Tax=Pseudodonghicola sp. TaxID=1969463 RepID=UPI003A96ED74